MIEIDDFLLFCDRTFDGYRRALERLDDDTVNAVPDLPSPNSPFQLVIHAVSAAHWWTAHITLGQPVDRDRPAEFEASGTIDEALAALDQAQLQLHEDAPELAIATELAEPPQTQTPLGKPWTVGAALIHTYEELAQHLGHLEITVDLVAK